VSLAETLEVNGGVVSVVIPTYNRERFLPDALDSIWAQTHRPIELIVVDDGSTDGTPRVVEQWRQEHGRDSDFRLRYLRQENRGAPAARNHGLTESQGEYVKFLDSDDILTPDALARQIAAVQELAADPNFIVFGDIGFMDEKGAERAVCKFPAPPERGSQVPYLLNNVVVTACPLYPRELLTRLGGFDESLPRGQEVELNLRLALGGARFVYQTYQGALPYLAELKGDDVIDEFEDEGAPEDVMTWEPAEGSKGFTALGFIEPEQPPGGSGGGLTGAVDDAADDVAAADNHDLASAAAIARGAYPGLELAAVGEEDWYALELAAGESAAFRARFSHAEGDLDLSLHAADGSRLRRSQSTADEETFDYTATAAETVYLRVYGYQGATGDYDLTVE